MEVLASGFTHEMQRTLEQEHASHGQDDTGDHDSHTGGGSSEEQCIGEVESDKCTQFADAVDHAEPCYETQTYTAMVRHIMCNVIPLISCVVVIF